MSSRSNPDAADAQDDRDASAQGAEATPPTRKKKRKKKRKQKPPPAAPPLASDGPLRTRFLEKFPSDPELDRLVQAFEAGDYASVRLGAPQLADKTEDPRVRDAALELRRRIEPDPLVRYMLFASIGLLLFMILYFYGQRS